MAEKLFALSEDTKDKLLELIGRKPAPDKYANKTPTMREYYSRMWVVKLDDDLPGMYDKRGVKNNLNCVDAYVFEANEYERLAQRVWNSENVKLRKKVYNQSRETLPANDEDGNPIFYTAIQDMLGTIWVQPRVKNEYFVINKGWNGEGTPPNTPSIFTKGSLHYVRWDGSDWVPHSANENSSSSTVLRPSGAKLVVCQGDAPTGAKDFPMRYFTPESNMGVPPSFTSSISFFTASRCGVKAGEHSFTNKFCDYSVVDGCYEYNPQFTAIATVDGIQGGAHDVYADICGDDWLVQFPNSNAGLGATNFPDIYPYDQILVLIDCEGKTCFSVDYPTDYEAGTVMAFYGSAPGRGWDSSIVTTPQALQDVGLTLYQKVKTNAIL